MGAPRISEDRINSQLWRAGRDLVFARLRVAKGELLPDKYQYVSHIRWMKREYGDDVVYRGAMPGSTPPGTPPAEDASRGKKR